MTGILNKKRELPRRLSAGARGFDVVGSRLGPGWRATLAEFR